MSRSVLFRFVTTLILVFALTTPHTKVLGEAAPVGSTTVTQELQLASGVLYQALNVTTRRGTAKAHVVQADLRQPAVSVDLIYSGVVAKALPLSDMANAQKVIAGVNADFFNISATQPGVVATNASVGPAIAAGVFLKGAVPNKQRFGPGLPQGVTVEDVIGVGVDRVGRIGRITLQGAVRTPQGTYQLNGLNQYAIAQGGIGAFTWRWGSVERKRAICGTDAKREDVCSTDVYEVTVSQGRVVSVSAKPGVGSIPEDSVVLLGREAGAQRLRQLQIGDVVDVNYSAISSEQVPFTFAVGCQPLIRNGQPIAGLDNATAAVRSGAGFSADGQTMYLLALDRNAGTMTYAELAGLLLSLGAYNGVNLDGGGSSTLVIREPGNLSVTVKNMAPTDAQRSIPNGIGVFVHP